MEINLKERNNRLFFEKKLTISNSEYGIYKKIGCIRTICLRSDTPSWCFIEVFTAS